MPRLAGSGKRQQGAAGHRDSRQDNGFVGPSKRATGKKSLAHLEGSARQGDHGVSHAAQSLPCHASTNGGSKGNIDAAAAGLYDTQSGEALRRGSLGNFSETSSESCNSHLGPGNGNIDGSHRQIDVNAMKNSDVHRDSGPLDMIATVLKSLPMQDTLAILIILMQLPSMSLSIIYAIFTCLTFVPPVTTSSGININLAEIFDGHSTMPSLVTVLCMDFFFLLIWLFLWQPIQDAILDLAKPVIAVTLGGGSSSRSGSSRGITTCFTWIALHHFIRGTKTHWSSLVRHIPENWRLPISINDSFEPETVNYDMRSPYAWIQSGLAIHILTQGLVRYIREWYLRREKANTVTGINDPEAGKSQSTLSGMNEASHDAGFNTPDTEACLPAVNNSASSTSKKRRKQSTQVRLQQPLWAALASTKIVVMKEYELSSTPTESVGSNATDIHNLGNAPFDTQPRQIWISYIGSDEVCFSTSYFPHLDCDSAQSTSNRHITRPAGVDTSKPFYVRVNNAFWQPTRIFPISDTEDDCDKGTRWTGDIYGLRPSSKYVCEFVNCRTDKVMFTTSIRTVKEPLRNNSSPAVVTNSQPSLQPDSPATTLRTSIAAAEAKLADEKNRLKTWRKEWKTRINALKKENELTDNQVASAGGSDEKYKQKVRQQETQKAQAERDTENLAESLKGFDASPELAERKRRMDKTYAAEKKQFDAAQKSFREHTAVLESEVKAKECEKANLNTKRNKIATRIAKIENELANIADANNRGLNEVERRRAQRATWQEQLSNIENGINERIAVLFASNFNRIEHAKAMEAQLQSTRNFMGSVNGINGIPMDLATTSESVQIQYQQLLQQQQQQQQQQLQANAWNPNPAAAPHFPTGMWAGGQSSGDMMPATSMPMAQFGASAAWHAPPTATSFEPRSSKARGRSSSMLSDISGFTEDSHEESSRSPISGQRVPLYSRGRPGFHGSNGSSGSGGNGSIGDPASPA